MLIVVRMDRIYKREDSEFNMWRKIIFIDKDLIVNKSYETASTLVNEIISHIIIKMPWNLKAKSSQYQNAMHKLKKAIIEWKGVFAKTNIVDIYEKYG